MFAIVIAGAAPAAANAASTYAVTGFADGNGTCLPTSPSSYTCPTLRAAASAAQTQTGAMIQLSPGIYQLSGQLPIGATTIQGAGPGGAAGTTIEQTAGAGRVLEVQSGPAMLVGLEITGGRLANGSSPGCSALGAGGGILAQATLTLENVLVDGNQVLAPAGSSGTEAGCVQGGGIAYTNGGGGRISDSTITGNSATGGAGGAGGGSGGPAYGGGVADIDGASLVIERSTIAQNTVTGGDATSPGGDGGSASGGGIFVQGVGTTAVAQLINSTVISNSVQAGTAGAGGSPGSGAGGGFLVQGANAQPSLQSDTIDANRAPDGANLSLAEPFAVHDTIIAGGGSSNCAITAPATSEANNLEDDAAGQCGFRPANQDLVGANPQLPAGPGENGGPTQTLAPATTSPVLRAGGRCVDPSSNPPDQLLSVDQRSEPRPNPCDIGAFQSQPPQDTVRPVISGQPARGQTLTCSDGAWTGDGPLELSFQWLRNGRPVPGAVTNSYVLGKADPGQSLACQVTGTHYGSSTATSTFVVARSYPRTTWLKVSLKDGAIVASLGCRGVGRQRCTGVLVATAVERLRGGKIVGFATAGQRAVTLARRRYSLLARRTATVRLPLSRGELKLVARFGLLPARLTIRQTTAAGTANIASRRLKVRPTIQATRRSN